MIDESRLFDKEYRMNNLYYIIDKNGDNILFVMNEVQREVFHNLHNKNLILKARQLGMSTMAILYLLDEVLFCHYTSAGIVSYSLPHAQHIFKNIVGHAINNFPLKSEDLGIKSQSTKEITFNNGSNFRVDTSLRGGTTQLVLITEFGKTCSRSPAKSEEIITGTLESVPTNGIILIESTGEGTSGAFTEACLAASARGNEDLTTSDYKLHFFPWFTESKYTSDEAIEIDICTKDYFTKLEHELDMEFSLGQKKWYQKKWEWLGEKVQQEYPSTISESFVSNAEAFYFAKALQDARQEDRICSHSVYDPLLPVYVAADIGVTDLTVITFFQLHHGERRIIDYYADTNKDLDFYVNHLINEKRYIYHTIALPHDSVKKGNVTVDNIYFYEFKRLFAHTGTKVIVLDQSDRNAGIGNAVHKTRKTVFDETKCKDYITHISKYQKKWSEQLSRYVNEPLHNVHSDYADSYRYAHQLADRMERMGAATGAMSRHREVVASRAQRI